MKKVLIISSSPRRKGNSDCLCDEFLRGAIEAGNSAEKIFLADKKVNYCNGCDVCSTFNRPCPQIDDASEIISKMISADVIVLSTPVYFYSISAQIKTLIDRCCGRYGEIRNKIFYFILTAADPSTESMERSLAAFYGFLDCLTNPTVNGTIFGAGVWHKGEIKGNRALEEAYAAGKSIS
jgi:multimeric flavodoxin WrbA